MNKEQRKQRLEKRRASRQPVGYTVGGLVALAGGAVAVSRELNIAANSVRMWTKIPTKHAHKVADMAKLHLAVVRPDMVRAVVRPDLATE